MKKQISLCVLLLSFIASYGQKLNDLEWLLGDWVSGTPENQFIETWTKKNDSTFTGAGKVIVNGDEKFAESLIIENRSGNTKYIAELPDKTAVFKAASQSANSIEFVDPQNDFPSKIIYRKTDSGITVILEGVQLGKEVQQNLDFIEKHQ